MLHLLTAARGKHKTHATLKLVKYHKTGIHEK